MVNCRYLVAAVQTQPYELLERIVSDVNGAKVAEFLVDNPAEMHEILALDPVSAGIKIANEIKPRALSKTPKVSGAPEPIADVKGGGTESQIAAARLAIARSLVEFTKSAELKKEFLKYDRNLLISDVRRKEACKPGDSKARKKRQKSFR